MLWNVLYIKMQRTLFRHVSLIWLADCMCWYSLIFKPTILMHCKRNSVYEITEKSMIGVIKKFTVILIFPYSLLRNTK